MKYRHLLLMVSSSFVFATAAAFGQGGPPGIPALPEPPSLEPGTNQPAEIEQFPVPEEIPGAAPLSQRIVAPQIQPRVQPEKLQSFEFAGADLDTVMTMYCEWTDKIYLKNDSVTASISLKADKLTIPECIEVVEAILAMNNIAIAPFGEKFIKVVNITDYQKEGAPVGLDTALEYKGTDRLITQLIELQNVQISDVQTAIQHLMHPYGNIQTLEGSNGLLVTDTEANVLRIRELVDFIDQASAKIEPRFYQVQYADAVEIESILNEIITMAQQGQSSSSARTTTTRTRSGVIRAAARPTPAAAARTVAAVSTAAYGGPAIIQGEVKVMADERTNLILIFSQKENFEFFDKIVKTFDVEVEPAITFEVVNLEYADAEELAGTLNELVGAAQGSRSTSSGTSSSSSTSRSRTSSSRTSSRRSSTSRTSTGGAGVPGTMVTPNAEPEQAGALANLNQLSEETRILADTRSNSILLMGMKSDIAAIKNVIASLDVMLEQVIIEAAIFEIGLNDSLQHGIEWLYRSQDGNKIGAWDGAGLITNPVANVASGALTYYQNVTGINTELAINLAATDSDARVLATPVIMTTDNTEATLSIGEQRPVVTSTDSFGTSSGTLRSSYEYKDIGIQLTVTPRINPQRFVVMEISQQADQLGGTVTIDNNDVPIILNRQFDASIAVPDRGTIALGGLMTTEFDDAVTKIPILGDIPLIGRYLFSSVRKTEVQRELLVLMTPYVMTNDEELNKETERIYKRTSLKPTAWNWSDSHLREIPDDPEALAQYEYEQSVSNPSMQQERPDQLPVEQKEELYDLIDTM